jgi:5-methylcytosine-specific restriction endonuclease McrA
MDSPCKDRKYCSKKCVGKESKKTFKPNFTTVRKAMISRGLINQCNRCGFDKESKVLGVHHKDRNRNNNKMSNLEVLCPNCHSLEHIKHIVVHA